MTDIFIELTIKAEKTTTKSVHNFYQELGDFETVEDLLDTLINWTNDEMGTNFILVDGNISEDVPEYT